MREPARNDGDARRRYLGHLQRSLDAVVSHVHWLPGKGDAPDEWIAVTAPSAFELPRRGAPLWLRATQTFHYAAHPDFPGERKVSTDEYAYTLYEDAEMGTELLSWHWQPRRGHPDPHIHIGMQHPDHERSTKWHIPTGRVAFEHVLMFAVHDLDVEPVAGHDNAVNVLNEVLARLRRFATWGFDGP